MAIVSASDASQPARTFQVLPWVAAAALLLAMLPPLLHSDPAVAASQVTFVRSFGEPGRPQVSPGGIDVDAGGAVYLANTGNDTVAKYAPGASAPTWTVGDRGHPLATPSFENPRDVAVLGNLLYVAQPSGVVVLSAADGRFLRSLSFGFKVPIGISIGNDPAGNPLILVSDGNTGKVEVFNSAEQHVRSIPAMTANSGTRDADTDSAGNYYVADYRNNRIAKFSPQGAFIKTWGGAGAPSCAQIPKPYGVEVDDADRVYVAASNNNALRSFTADGACLRRYGTGGFGEQQLSQLRRVAVSDGDTPKIYAADLWGLKVLIYNFDGTLADPLWRLGDGQYPPEGTLNEMPAVAVGSGGVYTTDLNSHRVSRWSTAGALLNTWGKKGKGAFAASFNWPSGLGVDPRNGNLWVSDTHSNILKEFQPDGSGPIRSLGPGGTAPATFNFPHNIAIDSNGNLFVAEYAAGRVQSFSASLQKRWATTGIPQANGIAVDAVHNRVLVTSKSGNRIWSLNRTTGAKTDLGLPLGTSAGSISGPVGVAVAPDGHVWVTDGGHRVQEFLADGTYAGTTFGGFGTANGKFNTPEGLAFGSDGLLYVADSNNDRVQVFDIGQSGPMSTPNPTPTPTPTPTPPPAGDTYTYLGQQYDPAGVAPLYPAGAVADSDGTIYVASSGSDSVEKISPDGTQTRVVGGYNRPRDVALDADPGRLWVADTTSNALHLITTTGASVRSLRNIGLRAPFGIDVDGTGLYVADAYNYRVVKLRADNGAVIWSQKTCDGALDRPRDLALGEDGNVYAVDTVHNRVVVLNATTGACVRTFGSSGTAPGAYRNPRGIASDGSGGFYIAEAKGARVQHVTSQGQPISVSDSSGLNEPACVFARADEAGVCDTFANRIVMYSESGSVLGAASTVGGVPPAPTGFNQPFGAAFGTGGELYVSDMFNSRIIKFGTDGNYERTWGTFGSGNSRFQFPRGLAVTPDGQTLVVTDSENNRLSLYRPDGSFIRHVSPVGTKFGFPHQTALAPDGTYWIADTNNNRVVHMGSDGAVLSEFGGLQAPRGIALDASGDLYVSNSGANRVDKYSPAGSLLATVASSGTGDQQVRQPWNLVVVGNDLFVADGLNNRILVLRLDGSYVTQFNGDGTAAGRFDSPRGVAVGPDGTVAAVSFRSNRVTYWGPRSSPSPSPTPSPTPTPTPTPTPDSAAPTVGVTSPAQDQVFPSSPVALSGTAADDIGVVRVAVAIQDRVSKQWLQADGTFGPWATRLRDATLSDPGGTSTAWSFAFDPQRSGDFGVLAQSFDAAGNESNKLWRRFAITG